MESLQRLFARQDQEKLLVLLEGQMRVLEMVAEGAPLKAALDEFATSWFVTPARLARSESTLSDT